jgi:hypothetical protein
MSRIIDARGYITCPRVRAHYDRIAEHRGRMNAYDTIRSAEAYLKLVLRLEEQGKWDHDHADVRRAA